MPRRVTLALALLAFFAFFAFATASASAEVKDAAQVEARMAGIPQSGRTLGNAKAPLTLTYFHDLKCPFCHAFSSEVLPSVIRRYVRSGRVRLVAEPIAFVGLDRGADSRRAAAAALALGRQGKYWNFADLFYANQQDETTTYVTDDYLSELTTAIPGADVQRMLSQKSSAAVKKSLTRSKSLMAKLEFFGVPTVLLTPTGSRVKRSDEVERDPAGLSRAIRRQLKRLKQKR